MRILEMPVSLLSDSVIESLLKKYNVKPSKKLGQSFLKSKTVANNMVIAANISRKDKVLEIGGGLGILTEAIAREAGQVYVIEITPGLSRALHDLFREHDNVSIIEGDALSLNLPEVTKVVSNLPYSISSEVTFRLLRELRFEQAVLMYQKEFAQRMYAEPGTQNYSRLTINIKYQAEVEHLMEVSANLFYPIPAVDSVVVRLKHRTKGPRAKNDYIFHWMVTGLYSYPNKNLKKALGIWFRNIGADKKLVDSVIASCHGSLKNDDRLRTISVDNLILLADSVLGSIEEGTLPDPRGRQM